MDLVNERIECTNLSGQKTIHIELLEELGLGTFGMVYKASTGKNEFAVKFRLANAHIIKIYAQGVHKSKDFIVLELCTGGNLYELVQKFGDQDEAMLKTASYQLVDAISYLHNRGIVHRDIKSDNVLLKKKARSPEEVVVKLIDYGLSVEIDRNHASLKDFCGTLSNMAPEVLEGRLYTCQCDIFSFAAMLLFLLSKSLPEVFTNPSKSALISFYNDHTEEDLVSSLRIGYSVHCVDFLLAGLQLDPVIRISANQMKIHRWFCDHGLTTHTRLINT
ncbi:Serine/threonine-protein kinase 33 [Cichlidogyrus casuarinus]|uniref:Serine/threonine-protein kinase 33 n=1 Tax=Cichlidogyrus casuarinus TaxID=1844966 RepID=A0ABD2QAQ5_9PLAT